MPGIYDLMQGIQQQGEQGRQRGLAQLVGKAYGAPQERRQSILGAVAQRGAPDMALNADKAFGEQEDNIHLQMAKRAKEVVALYKANPQMAQQIYQNGLLPLAARAGVSSPPMQLDDTLIPGLEKLALVAQDPTTESRNFSSMTQGFTPEEVEKARRIQAGLAPRAVTGAMRFDTFTGADGRPRPQRNNPTTGGVDIFYDETGQWIPLGGQPTQRTSGEVPFSIDPSLPPEVQAAIRANPEAGSAQGITQLPGMEAARVPGLGVGRRAEDEAAAKAAAEEQAKLGLLDDRGRIEAENAGLQKSAELAATRASDRIENAPKARAALQVAKNAGENVKRAITQALPNINVWTAGYAGQPLSRIGGSQAANLRASLDTIEANIAFDRLQQMRESSPTGGALGSVSERELTLLGSALTSLKQSQSPAQLKSNLEFLARQYDKVLKQMEEDFNTDFGSARPAANKGLRFNPATGKIE